MDLSRLSDEDREYLHAEMRAEYEDSVRKEMPCDGSGYVYLPCPLVHLHGGPDCYDGEAECYGCENCEPEEDT